MQAHLCVEHTGILDVLGLQLDLLFINGRTGQLGQSLGNFLAGDLAVQAAGCAALGLDGHGLALDLCSHSLCGGHSFSLVEIRSGLLAACDIHRRSIGHSGQLAREQKVAGVAVGDLMDLILLANALYVLLQNHFHGVIPHFSPGNRWISMVSIQHSDRCVNAFDDGGVTPAPVPLHPMLLRSPYPYHNTCTRPAGRQK